MGNQTAQLLQAEPAGPTNTEENSSETSQKANSFSHALSGISGFRNGKLPNNIPLNSQNILSLQGAVGNRTTTRYIQNRLQLAQSNDVPVQGKFEPAQRKNSEGLLQGEFTAHGIETPMQDGLDHAENHTGMPDSLKAGLEQASGMDLSDVRVHKRSSKPAQLNALAYTQNRDIYIGPGQEEHLPHEGWHVVQQIQGRVKPTGRINGVAVNGDRALEYEADVMGSKAMQFKGAPGERKSGIEDTLQMYRSGGIIQPQQTSVVQRNPLAFAGLSAEAWAMASSVASVIATAGGAAAGTYVAVRRGENAVASLVLPQHLMSNGDKGKLKQIAQFRIINMYIERFLAKPENRHLREQLLSGRGPGATPGGGAPTGAGGTGGAGAGGTTPAGPEPPTGAPTASAIDQEVLIAVKNSVQTDLQATLETDPYSWDYELMWGEDDTRGQGRIGQSGTAESVGVTGFLRYRNLEASALRETLTLTPVANAAVGPIPNQGSEVVVHQFIGGSLGGYATWSAWDNLTVNVEGGDAQQSVHSNGSAKLIIRTHWYWDRWGPNSESNMQNEIYVEDHGGVTITWSYEGTP